jgi:cysteine desulfurase
LTVNTPVYLDHNATTPMDPRVLEVVHQAQSTHFGNPASSNHAFGWAAASLVEQARGEVAELLGATAREIIFTSGATEAANLALFGVAEAYRDRGRHLVTSSLEHEAVAGPLAVLEKRGWQVTRARSGADGVLAPEAVAEALRPDTVLVSIIGAQNEIGTLQPVSEIGALCKRSGVLFHCDAAQSAGKVPLDVQADGIDLLSLSGHKIYGPKGTGALFVRRRDPRVTLEPLLHGGGQERGMRPGTLNVPGIAGLGAACSVAAREMTAEGERLVRMRDGLWRTLRDGLGGVTLNGCPERRLPGNLNLSFEGVRAHTLLGQLTTLAVSSSSACSSSGSAPSAILLGLGLNDELAAASLRLGLGRFTTDDEVDFAAGKIIEVVTRLRGQGKKEPRR